MQVKKYFWMLCLLLPATSAIAINKCIAPDGRVSYQETACPSTTKNEQTLKVWDGKVGTTRNVWKFERKHDEMTGKVSCLAFSSVTFPKPIPKPTDFLPVHMVLVATKETEVIGLRTSDNRHTFHNDIQGMGLRTNNGSFIPFSSKTGNHVVGVADSAALIDMIDKSSELLVRARFWPYEQLYDMEPIASEGFAAALALARACAGR